jgi:hypothetical protein
MAFCSLCNTISLYKPGNSHAPTARHLCVTGSAPGGIRNLQLTTPITATTLTITWDASSGFLDRYEVTYSYTVKGCLATGSPVTINIPDTSLSSYTHTLRGLNEDSRHTITVRAINIVGSTMATITGDTLTAGELLRPYNYSLL